MVASQSFSRKPNIMLTRKRTMEIILAGEVVRGWSRDVACPSALLQLICLCWMIFLVHII